MSYPIAAARGHIPIAVSVAPSPLLTNLLAYWKLDEATGATRVDSTPNHYDMADNGNVVQDSPGATAIQGHCARFLNNRFLGPGDPTVFSMGGKSFTFAFWLRSYPTLDFSGGGWVVGKYISSSKEYWVNFSDATHIQFNIRSSDDTTTTTIISSVALAIDTWYFVAVRHDNTNHTQAIRVNATLDSQAYSLGVNSGDGTTNFYINAAFDGSAGGGNEVLDEYGCWTRALTNAELDSLYNGGIGTTHPFS